MKVFTINAGDASGRAPDSAQFAIIVQGRTLTFGQRTTFHTNRLSSERALAGRKQAAGPATI